MRWLAWATGVWIVTASSMAFAQPTEAPPVDPDAQRTAIARALFEEGLELADREQWAAAADRFHRANEVRSSGPIRYNLAGSLARLGRVVEAIELLHSVEDDAEAEEAVVNAARRTRRRLERRLARLSIEVPEEHEGATVLLDELELPREATGVAFPVDPGQHVVMLRRDGTEIDRAEVELASGQEGEVRFAPPAVAATGGRILSQAWFWGAVSMVVVGAAVATLIVINADDDSPSGAGVPLVAF